MKESKDTQKKATENGDQPAPTRLKFVHVSMTASDAEFIERLEFTLAEVRSFSALANGPMWPLVGRL